MSDFYLTLPSHSSKTEFPDNKSNHFKIRLPHPKKLEGSGWRVGLTAISLPDSHCRVPVFTEGQYGLFKMGWKRKKGSTLYSVYKEYKPTDVVQNFDAVDGVGFMKSMVNFFEQNRISNNGVDDQSTFGWYFAPGGKRLYIKFKWEGDELVTDNEDTDKSSSLPLLMIRKDLAQKMKWVVEKEDGTRHLGPNLQQELFAEKVPDLNAPGVFEDVQKGDKKGVCLDCHQRDLLPIQLPLQLEIHQPECSLSSRRGSHLAVLVSVFGRGRQWRGGESSHGFTARNQFHSTRLRDPVFRTPAHSIYSGTQRPHRHYRDASSRDHRSIDQIWRREYHRHATLQARIMRGGSLTRFRPDDQFGSGFVRDFIGSSVKGGWEGLKTGGVRGLPNIAGGIRGVKKGGKRVLKRKAEQVIQRNVKRKLNDIFGT